MVEVIDKNRVWAGEEKEDNESPALVQLSESRNDHSRGQPFSSNDSVGQLQVDSSCSFAAQMVVKVEVLGNIATRPRLNCRGLLGQLSAVTARRAFAFLSASSAWRDPERWLSFQ